MSEYLLELKKKYPERRTKISSQAYSELVDAVGSENISNDLGILAAYVYSAISPAGGIILPDVVVTVRELAEVVNTIKVANKYKIPVTAVSGGMAAQGAIMYPYGGIVMDFRWMNKVLEVNTEAGYAVIEPGVSSGKLQAVLRRVGWRGLFHGYPPGASQLANYFSRVINHTMMSRYLNPIIAAEVVLGTGEVIHTGSMSRRIHEFNGKDWWSEYNGWVDLTGLFLRTFGTLGFVTKAAVRIAPIGEKTICPIFGFDDIESSLKFGALVARDDLAMYANIQHWRFYMMQDMTLKENIRPREELLKAHWSEPPAPIPQYINLAQASGRERDMGVRDELICETAKKMGGTPIVWEGSSVDGSVEFKDIFPGSYQVYKHWLLDHYQEKGHEFRQSTRMIAQVFAGPTWALIPAIEDGMCWLEKKFKEHPEWPFFAQTFHNYWQPVDYGRYWTGRFSTYVENTGIPEQFVYAASTCRELREYLCDKYGIAPGGEVAAHVAPKTEFVRKRFTQEYHDFMKKIKDIVDPNHILQRGLEFYREESMWMDLK